MNNYSKKQINANLRQVILDSIGAKQYKQYRIFKQKTGPLSRYKMSDRMDTG